MLSEVRDIKVGAAYRHFKGSCYIVIQIATHTETGERMVIYQDTKDKKKVWARPYEMFNSLIDKEKYPQAEGKYRFEEIKEN